jgi:glutamate synthase (NADPH/NADH) small chain
VYRIPEFRLPKNIVAAEMEKLKLHGVDLRNNIVTDKPITIYQIMNEIGYGVVSAANVAGSPKFIGIPGENFKGVYSASEFLTRVNLMKANRSPEYDTPMKMGGRMSVIGAGSTVTDGGAPHHLCWCSRSLRVLLALG